MKKIFLALVTLAVINSFCFAGEETPTGIKSTLKLGEMQAIRGIINSIKINNNPMIGNQSELVITEQGGEKMTFVVRTGIGITAPPADKLLTLKHLKKDDIVTVEYMRNKNGVNKIMSIELESY